jgi:hypothetical protein
MKDLFKRVALLLKSSLIPLTFSILGFSAHADNYYVSVNGNDLNSGTIEKPFVLLKKQKK